MGAAMLPAGGDSMNRCLPPIHCVFVGMVAILVSSCARFCPGPEPAYAAPPYYGSPPGVVPQYGQPPGMPRYEQTPGQYEPPPQFEPPPGAYGQH
jgi:hypothetical protein